MSSIRLFILFVFVACLASCRDKVGSKTAEARAEGVIRALTPERLAAFQQWAYSGKGNVWYKGSQAQAETTARFEERNDSMILAVRKPDAFIREFQLDIPLESRLHGLTLVKSVDTCFFISEDALIGGYRWTTLDCSVDTVFRSGNPFLFFRDLTRFKDSLAIVEVDHANAHFIQFYFADGYVLTYLPKGSVADLEQRWQDELGRGEMIEKNWNLRQYNKLRPTP